MNTWIQRLSLPVIVMMLPLAATVGGQPHELHENTWSNPDFVNWFTGSYAFNGEVNPRINSDEEALFKEIAELMQDQPDAAIEAIEAFITEASAGEEGEYSPALDYTLGSLHLQNGSLATAMAYYEKAIDRFPTFQRAFQNLGLARVQAGDHAKAVPALTKAIELGANSGTVWGLVGFSYLNLGKPTQALSAYNQALLFQPESADWKTGKLNALLDANELEGALALLDEMLAEDPEATNLWLQQANAFLGKGRTLEAAANLEWVARQGGASGQSFLLLGDIYLNEGMSPLAVRAYEAALESSEPGADRLLTVVDNLFTRGATGQAQTFLETVREALEGSLPEDQELRALNLEAQLALAEGRRDEAAGLLRSIIERDPLNGAALISLGDYYRDTGKTEEAVLQYERATRIEEVEVRALHALARMHVARKDYQEALHFLSEAQAIEPRPYVADYIEQLERVVRSL